MLFGSELGQIKEERRLDRPLGKQWLYVFRSTGDGFLKRFRPVSQL